MCDVGEINVLANPGRGVTVMKLDDDDNVVGFAVNEPLVLESDKGKTEEVKALKKDRVPRGSQGAFGVLDEGERRARRHRAADGAGAPRAGSR